ncbi:MAG TPA: fatty acid desaturase [Solirubrobacteraceae bacterium]|jgi:stearoyl-CoA desaturase (delta-9 desaturase)
MTKTEKTANLSGVIVPFLGVLAAIVLLWNSWVDITDLSLLVGFYLLSAIGVTVGFHRLLTHRSFQTYPWLERTFAGLGSLAVQGSVLDWVADHRKHHAHTDAEGDPHSPHVGHGSGLKGLWHAHAGWLTETQGQADWKRYAPDLYEDPRMRRLGRRFPALAALSLLLPTLAGLALHDWTLQGAIRGFIWGGLVRIFLVHHVTWSVNSVCHFFGSRRFEVDDRSTNVAWLALPSLGESWHHNHHAFPRSAEHGLRWWEIDPSALLISGLEKTGLAWNVVRINPERQAGRLAPRGGAGKRVVARAPAPQGPL